jgi:hypothetical protein
VYYGNHIHLLGKYGAVFDHDIATIQQHDACTACNSGTFHMLMYVVSPPAQGKYGDKSHSLLD